MHPPSALLLIVVAAGIAVVRGLPPAAGTPAAQFWEKALPGTPMPEAIADLVQRGIDHSPLEENLRSGLGKGGGIFGEIVGGMIGGAIDSELNKPQGPPHKHPPQGKPAASSEKAVATTGIFFHEAQVREGSVMVVAVPPAAAPAILPRHVAEKAAFTNLTDVLSTFHIAPGSAGATLVGETLLRCQAPPVAGEQKACATSLEGTVQAAARMLQGASTTTAGDRTMWAAASALPRGGLPREAYVVTAVAELDGDRHVRCHAEPFPYAVFECLMARQSSATKAYMITLSSLHGGSSVTVAMVVLCHLDTSYWNPAHPAFEILHTVPGGEPVCHLMQYASLVFGEKAANA
ncbi:hypothetical protein ACP70R_033347 [Stipagrostis hirtigluma subsp. patula]